MFDTRKKLVRANAVIAAQDDVIKAQDHALNIKLHTTYAQAHINCQNTIIADLRQQLKDSEEKRKEANETIEILNECNTNANKEIRRLSRIKKQDQTEEPERCVSSTSITFNGVVYVPKQTNE